MTPELFKEGLNSLLTVALDKEDLKVSFVSEPGGFLFILRARSSVGGPYTRVATKFIQTEPIEAAKINLKAIA